MFSVAVTRFRGPLTVGEKYLGLQRLLFLKFFVKLVWSEVGDLKTGGYMQT